MEYLQEYLNILESADEDSKFELVQNTLGPEYVELVNQLTNKVLQRSKTIEDFSENIKLYLKDAIDNQLLQQEKQQEQQEKQQEQQEKQQEQQQEKQ